MCRTCAVGKVPLQAVYARRTAHQARSLSAPIFGYLKLVLTHAAAVRGVDVAVEFVNLARVALKRLGLVGKSRQRDRRPTADELKRLLEHFDNNRFLMIPMGRIVRFAIASAMRQEEICRIRWSEGRCTPARSVGARPQGSA